MTKKIALSVLVHILIVWVILTLDQVLPYMYRVHLNGNFLWKEDGTATTPFEYGLLLYYKPNIYHFLSLLFILVPLTEMNYWFVVKNYRLNAAITGSLVIGFIMAIAVSLPWNADMFNNTPFYPIYAMLAYGAYCLIYGLVRKYFYERAHRQEVLLQQSQNELNALKAQLNPHFFFNSLNYLYGTALREQARDTASAISTLSDLMRYTISGMQQNFVPLVDELKFMKDFLALQQARLPVKDTIKIEIDITAASAGQIIAPLLLLPFIDNAFKYGISIDHPCFIKISINIDQHQLLMDVTNSVIEQHAEIKGNNTGIANSRKRLELLYPGKHTLQYGEVNAEYRAHLKLNLQ